MTDADQDDQERQRIVLRIAVHEAGHGAITVLLGHDVSDVYVDIDLGAEGHTSTSTAARTARTTSHLDGVPSSFRRGAADSCS